MIFPRPLQELIDSLSELPGIGPRQATRFAFFLLKRNNVRGALYASLENLQQNIVLCTQCFLPHEKEAASLCAICSDEKRQPHLVCVVEKETDAARMEQMKLFNGRYFVLGGTLHPFRDTTDMKQRALVLKQQLQKIIAEGKNPEIVIALNTTREGLFTASYIEELLKDIPAENLRITRLGRGLATGSEIEYADEETLRNALEGRK